MPFDVLAEKNEIRDRLFEIYYRSLADHIHESVSKNFNEKSEASNLKETTDNN